MSSYGATTVPVSRSQDQIRQLLRAHGADGFTFREVDVPDPTAGGQRRRVVSLEFLQAGQVVRMLVALKLQDEAELLRKARRARTKTHAEIVNEAHQQEERRIWRVIFHSLKARMVAVEEQVETFEQAFLAHLVDPATGQTLYDAMVPAIEAGHFQVNGQGLKALGMATDSTKEETNG